MYSDGLILVAVVADDRFCQNVEGAAEKNIISGRANDVNLHVYCKIADEEGYIAREAERVVDGTISGLHTKNNRRVIRDAQVMAHFFRHRDYLTAAVEHALDLLHVVDERVH